MILKKGEVDIRRTILRLAKIKSSMHGMQPRFPYFRPIQRSLFTSAQPKEHELLSKVHPMQHHRAASRILNLGWRIRHSK